MKKKSPKLVSALVAVLTFANVFSLTGCRKTENIDSQTNQEVQFEISETEQTVTSAHTDAEVQTDEQSVGTGGIMRTYSDKEKERMAKLQQSYQSETAKPEKMIQEVDSADEELLQIIDCNFRIALNTNHKTQEEWDEITLKERAELEAKVKAAGGITEDEAIEIAEKAMERDLGEKAKELKLHEVGDYGWKAYLWDITDWDEYQDKGEIGWFVGFDNLEDFEGNPDNLEEIENFMFSYNCTVNAMDGSICGAYSRKGFISGEDT